MTKGWLEIFRRRTIVEDDDLYNTLTEIEYSDAIKIEPGLPGRRRAHEEVDIQKEFGRRAILAGKADAGRTYQRPQSAIFSSKNTKIV